VSGKTFSSFFIIGLTAGLLVFFNNCSPKSGFEVSSAASENLAEGVDNSLGASEFSFKSGDVISEVSLRAVSSTLADAFSVYQSASEGKAMAVPLNRQGAVAVGNYKYGSSVEEQLSSMKDHVLNLCFMRYQSPCILIAVGEKFSLPGSVLSEFFKNQNLRSFSDPIFSPAQIQSGEPLLSGMALSVKNMPVVRNSSLLTDYLSYSGFKALAVSWKGRVMWLGSSSGSQAEADRRVIEYCQVKTGDECVTFASGNQMSLSSSDRMSWTLPQSGDVFDVNKIPLISEATRSTVQGSSVLANLNNGINTVFYLSEVGQVSGSSSASKTLEELEATAKSSCEGSAGNYKCFLYSKNKQVVFNITRN